MPQQISSRFIWKFWTKSNLIFVVVTMATLISWKWFLFNIGESPFRYWHGSKNECTPINSRGNDLCALKNDMWLNTQNTVCCFCANIAPIRHWIELHRCDRLNCHLMQSYLQHLCIVCKPCRLKFQRKEKCIYFHAGIFLGFHTCIIFNWYYTSLRSYRLCEMCVSVSWITWIDMWRATIKVAIAAPRKNISFFFVRSARFVKMAIWNFLVKQVVCFRHEIFSYILTFFRFVSFHFIQTVARVAIVVLCDLSWIYLYSFCFSCRTFCYLTFCYLTVIDAGV